MTTKNNPKRFWEQIKWTYPSDKNHNPIRFSDNNGNILNNSQTATLINKYFTNIGPDLAKVTQELARNIDTIALNAEINQHNPNCPTLNLQHPPIEQRIKKINDIKAYIPPERKTSGVGYFCITKRKKKDFCVT